LKLWESCPIQLDLSTKCVPTEFALKKRIEFYHAVERIIKKVYRCWKKVEHCTGGERNMVGKE
jgi:hypothetical protein